MGITERTAEAERVELLSLRARVAELEAIIAGRTTPPSAAESEAHAAAGGSWRVVVGGKAVPWAASEPVSWSGIDGGAVRRIMRDYSDGDPWCWALDADGRPCAWPVAP